MNWGFMGTINIVQKIKEIHPLEIILVEIGSFYNLYGRDAYIISYLFGYNLKKIENTYSCGFPKNCINKVTAKLENKKINYICVDKRNNYDVLFKFDNKNLNAYSEFYEKSKKYINIKNRINNITEYLNKNINDKDIKELLCKMEKVINERRKV